MKTFSRANEDFTNKIASEIGYAILHNFNGDFKKTYEFLNNCRITDIYVARTSHQIKITITSSRPCLTIGRKGSMINYLQNYLKENNNGVEVKIDLKEPGRWMYHLYPMTLDEASEIGGF